MGSMCRIAENEQNTQCLVLINVKVKNIPDKQQLLEKYGYNLKENVDRFEDEFYQRSFNMEIENKNVQKCKEGSEILSQQDKSQQYSIENNLDIATESQKESSNLELSEHQYKSNQKRECKQSKFYSRDRHNSQNNSPLKSILKMPQSYQKISDNNTERSLKNRKIKNRVRFMSSEKQSESSVERKSQKQRMKKKQQYQIKNKKFKALEIQNIKLL